MKVLRNSILKDGTGEITLLPELDEDMWHAYNLISVGDCIRATTLRYEQARVLSAHASLSL
jgi:protein pelota